jgi:hypothetical protein
MSSNLPWATIVPSFSCLIALLYHDRLVRRRGIRIEKIKFDDAVVINAVVIPLEEWKPAIRFGSEYEECKRLAPFRFLPLRRVP